MLNPSSPNSQLIDAPAGKLEVDALWHNNNPQDPTVEHIALLCHPNPLGQGTMMNKIITTMYRFARDFHKENPATPMHVVRFNYRGVGQSTGSYGDMTGEIQDALTVLQWIKSQTNTKKLWLGGFSFGGYVAMGLVQILENEGLALGLDDFSITNLALIAPSIQRHDTNGFILPNKQTFMIFGENDELVAPHAMIDFAENFGIRYQQIDDTGHFFHGKLGELMNLLKQNTVL